MPYISISTPADGHTQNKVFKLLVNFLTCNEGVAIFKSFFLQSSFIILPLFRMLFFDGEIDTQTQNLLYILALEHKP